MNISLRLPQHQLEGLAATGAGFALSMSRSPESLRHEWQALERGAVTTLFQSYDWIASWCASAAAAEGEDPLFVIGRDGSGALAFILPFAVRRILGASHLTWLAQEHSGYGFGVYRQDCLAQLDSGVLHSIIHWTCSQRPDIAGVYLVKQPASWYGQPNPFAALPRRHCTNEVLAFKLRPDFTAFYNEYVTARTREKDRRKLRKLRSAGTAVFDILQDLNQRLEGFDTLTSQKSQQLAETGESNGLAEPHIRSFYHRWIAAENSNAEVLLASLSMDGKPIAIDFCVRFQAIAYSLNRSMSSCEHQRLSPGRALYLYLLERLCQDGCAAFDLGPGVCEYKQQFGAHPVSLFNTIYPVRSAGYMPAALLSIVAACKRAALSLVKTNPRLGNVLFATNRMCRRIEDRFR